MNDHEYQRIQIVKQLLNLPLSKKEQMHELVNLAAQICQTPTALVTFIDNSVQHIPYKIGFKYDNTRREDAFCNYVIEQYDTFVINDATKDERFKLNPLVIDDPNIVFYAGSPLSTSSSLNVGSLCVIDYAPRQLTDIQLKALKTLSVQVINLLELELTLATVEHQYNELDNLTVKLRAIFESSVNFHLLLDRNLKILAFNKMMSSFIYQTHGVILEEGHTIESFFNSEYNEPFLKQFQKALLGETIKTKKQVSYQNTSIWWDVVFEPAYHPNGEIIGVSFNLFDNSQNVKNEQKIATQKELLHEVAFMQSHELRKPVANILGLMSLIREKNYEDAREELFLLNEVTEELDEKIKLIVNTVSQE